MFSLPCFPREPSRYLDLRDSLSSTVIVTPSHTADVVAEPVPRDGKYMSSDEVTAFCAGAFLYNVRGLPSEEIEVETPGGVYRISRCSKTDKISIILPKCKVLYTKKKEIIDEIEIFVSAFSYKNYIFKVCECKNSAFFADANLRALLRSSIEDSIDGVAVYSIEKDEVLVKLLPSDMQSGSLRLYALLATATAALSRSSSKCLTLTYGGGCVCVEIRHDEILLSDKTLRMFKLSAPDIE